MDDGEIEFSGRDAYAETETSQLECDYSLSPTWENFELDEYLKTCTHRHTCNPPGPDNTHTHTCFHTHTQIFAGEENEEKSAHGDDSSGQQELTVCSKKKRPVGNKEAVRKYRQKKKAQAVHLEEQVAQLKSINQRLLRRLQGQAALEAEVVRLRTLLSDVRGRIDAEVERRVPAGISSVQTLPGGYYLNSFRVPCASVAPCHGQPQGGSSDQVSVDDLGWHAGCEYSNDICQSRETSVSLSPHCKPFEPEVSDDLNVSSEPLCPTLT